MQSLLCDLGEVLIDPVHRVILHDELGCGLGSDLRNARDVVRRIPLQSLDLDELLRGYLIGRHDICGIIILDVRLPLLRLRDPDPYMLV